MRHYAHIHTVNLISQPPHDSPPPHTHTYTPFYGLFSRRSGPPGWASAWRELLDFTVQGKINEAETPTIRLGATPSGLTSAHLHHAPIFYRPDALPATQPTVSKQWRQPEWFFSSTCYETKPFGISGIDFLQPDVLPVTQPCHSTEDNSKHWHQPVASPHPLFIYHRTPERWGIALFTLAFQRQYLHYVIMFIFILHNNKTRQPKATT